MLVCANPGIGYCEGAVTELPLSVESKLASAGTAVLAHSSGD